jgi:hypothetical protein
MKQYVKLLAFLSFAALTFGCKKSSSGPDANIYVPACIWDTLFPGDHPVYWENNSLNYLSCDYGGRANALFVFGNDMYVGGQIRKEFSGVMMPVIWKNNVPQFLSDSIGTVNDLQVINGDVYAVGYLRNNGINIPVLWKNAQLSKLSIQNGGANSISVSGNDIYVSGGLNDPTQSFYTFPVIWKNGNLFYKSNNHGTINSVLYANGHLFAAITKNNGSSNAAILLIDSSETQFSNNGDARYVCIRDNDVYLSGGVTVNTTDYMPVVWKNGVIDTNLIHPKTHQELFAAAVKDNNYFAVGQDNNTKTVYLWINGAKQSLSVPGLNCIISKIFVQ